MPAARSMSQGQDGLGILLAERATARELGLTGALAGASATLGEALLHAMRLARVFEPSVQVSLHVNGEQACVAIETGSSGVTRATAEYMLAIGVLGVRALVGDDFAPSEVSFADDAPRDRTRHDRLFRSTVRFGAARSACYFPSSMLVAPIARADMAKKSSLTKKADLLTRTASGVDFARQARSAIQAEIRAGNPTCERVAARLGLHPKALVRRLCAQGIGYRALLEQVRFEVAEVEMRCAETRVTSIAERLGYSEKSAFNRAFKRWSGYSPLEYRKQLGISITSP